MNPTTHPTAPAIAGHTPELTPFDWASQAAREYSATVIGQSNETEKRFAEIVRHHYALFLNRSGNAKHSPLPWTAGADDEAKVEWVVFHESGAVCRLYRGDGRQEANAAFIVRACNEYAELKAKAHSHAALVDALEKSQLAFMNIARLARFESKGSLEAVAQLRRCQERNDAALSLASQPTAKQS